MHHVHFGMEVTAHPCRHPDGMESGYSVDAVTNRDPRHFTASSRPPQCDTFELMLYESDCLGANWLRLIVERPGQYGAG